MTHAPRLDAFLASRGAVQAERSLFSRCLPWYGLATVFLSDMPVLDLTLGGNLIRYGLLALGLAGVIYHYPLIERRIRGEEKALILLSILFLFVAMIFGTISNIDPNPRETARVIFPLLIVYGAAKCFAATRDIEKFWKYFYLLALVAASQALVATAADYLGIRHLFSLPLRVDVGGRYFLEWGGVLGGNSLNFRTDFYFSESSYFAHMLMPAIIYAGATARGAGFFILLLGFLTTMSAFASLSLAATILLLFAFVRIQYRVVLSLLVVILIGAFTFTIITENERLTLLLFYRAISSADKMSIIAETIAHLERYPMGIGPVNLPSHYMHLNTANGVFRIVAQLGFSGLFLLGAVALYLLYLLFRKAEGRFTKMMTLAVGGTLLAGFSHGPIFKYYLLFMLSALVLYRDGTE